MTLASGSPLVTIDPTDPGDFGCANRYLGEAAEDRLDDPCLVTFSVVIMHSFEAEQVSEFCTADPFSGAEFKADEEAERHSIHDLQASMQLSRSLSGVPGVFPDASDAWRELYERYNPWIRRAVRACRVRACDRHDCIQEVWSAILSKLGTFDSHRLPCRFRRWLATLIQNQIRNFLRQRVLTPEESLGRLESYPDRADRSPAAVYQQRTTQSAVREILAELRSKLPAASFSVIELRWLRDESVPDTAVALGITCEQVHYRQYRAMKKLGQLLKIRGLDELAAI